MLIQRYKKLLAPRPLPIPTRCSGFCQESALRYVGFFRRLLGQSAHVHSFAAVLLAAIGVVFCNRHVFLFAIIPAVAFLEGNKQDCWFQQDGVTFHTAKTTTASVFAVSDVTFWSQRSSDFRSLFSVGISYRKVLQH